MTYKYNTVSNKAASAIVEYIEHCSLKDLLKIYHQTFGEDETYKELLDEVNSFRQSSNQLKG